jgi:hypothetical protein
MSAATAALQRLRQAAMLTLQMHISLQQLQGCMPSACSNHYVPCSSSNQRHVGQAGSLLVWHLHGMPLLLL